MSHRQHVYIVRIKAGEFLYLPPGCIHSVLTLKSCVTISGNFFYKHDLTHIAKTWTYDFVSKHKVPCGQKPCTCDPNKEGYNKHIPALLARFSALALNGEVGVSREALFPVNDYFRQWMGLNKGWIHRASFKNYHIAECDCTLPMLMLVDFIGGSQKKMALWKKVLPKDGNDFPNWKSPWSRAIEEPYIVIDESDSDATDPMKDESVMVPPPRKRPGLFELFDISKIPRIE